MADARDKAIARLEERLQEAEQEAEELGRLYEEERGVTRKLRQENADLGKELERKGASLDKALAANRRLQHQLNTMAVEPRLDPAEVRGGPAQCALLADCAAEARAARIQLNGLPEGIVRNAVPSAQHYK